MGREDSTWIGVVMVQGDEDSTQIPPPAWPREARWLHAGIAFGVTWQIWSSLWMTPQWEHADYGSLGGLLFNAHAWIGLMTALFILWQWLWIASDRRIRRQFFPWSGPWQPVLADLAALARGRLSGGGPRPGLAALVHGLGLLTITWMALTGSAIYFFLPQGGALPGRALETLVPLHKLGNLVVWIYWCGHVAMTLLHALRREPIWSIFRLW
jgi:hypothetical protein